MALPWHKHPLNLIPLKNKINYFTSHHHFTEVDKWNFYTDLFGNIILFIPFAFFMRILFGIENKGKIILLAFLSSISVECIQFLFSIGVADIDDVIDNTIGAIIGLILLNLFFKKTIPLQ